MKSARMFFLLFRAICVGITLLQIGQFSHASEQTSATRLNSAPTMERPFVVLIQATDKLEDSPWFQGIDSYANNAATSLNIDFKHLLTGDDRSEIPKVLVNYIHNERRPDYLLFANQIEIAPGILQLCEEMGIKAFMINSPLSKKDRQVLGEPREDLTNWIGEIIPDDEQAGFELARILIEKARENKQANGETGKIKVIGISGTNATPASALRVEGLKRAIAMHEDAELLQVVSARWVPHVAAQKYRLLVSRYGEPDVVWAANDDMALGVLEEARAFKHMPAIGGFDWTPPAIRALQKGELSASMGGHDFEVAYALKILKAYHEGRDFLQTSGTTSLKSKLTSLTPETVYDHSNFLTAIRETEVDYATGLSALLLNKEDYADISIDQFKKNFEASPLADGAK